MSHYRWPRIACVTLFLWIVTGDVVNVPCLAGTLNEWTAPDLTVPSSANTSWDLPRPAGNPLLDTRDSPLPTTGSDSASGELREIGRIYNQAQKVKWLDKELFAVGRWDGTLTIFRAPLVAGSGGPRIVQSMTAPAATPLEMIDMLPPKWLVTSNTTGSIAVWTSERGSFQLKRIIRYPDQAGEFNSGAWVQRGKQAWYVSGHANGRLIRWRIDERSYLVPEGMIDIRSPDPIHSPYPIKNIRGVVHWRNGIVITGAEDGDLCLVDIVAGKVIFRMRYNPTAQRGINGLALSGELLLVTNCVVGASEHNLWLYRLATGRIALLDSVYVVTDSALSDIFSMDSILVPNEDGRYRFLVSTGEGLLWHGRIDHDKLQPVGYRITGHTGVAPVINYQPDRHLAAVADFDIRTFDWPSP